GGVQLHLEGAAGRAAHRRRQTREALGEIHVERGFERGARGRGQRHPVLGEEGARGIRIGGGGSVRRKGPVRRGSGQQRGEQEGVEHAAGGTSRGRGASSATLRADHVSRP